MDTFLNQYVVDSATIATLVGLALTFWVLIETKTLKKTFRKKARIPEIHSDLKECASRISALLRDAKNWENTRDHVSKEFAECIGLIESLVGILTGDDKRKANSLLDRLSPKPGRFKKRAREDINKRELAWSLYEDLSLLNTRLDQSVKDMNWG